MQEKDSGESVRTFLGKRVQTHSVVIRAYQLHQLEELYFDSSNIILCL